MKFSKKLLAVLLPITSVSALTPALSSCSKGNGYDINYGDEIDCLDSKSKTYHSIDDVKNSVKKHAFIEPLPSISEANLPNWDDSVLVKQSMYYDLVASLASLAKIQFHLTWTVGATYSINLVMKEDTKTGTSLSYARGDGSQINIRLMNEQTVIYATKSYGFQNTRIGE